MEGQSKDDFEECCETICDLKRRAKMKKTSRKEVHGRAVYVQCILSIDNISCHGQVGVYRTSPTVQQNYETKAWKI